MCHTVQQHAALIAESGRGVGGGDPAVFDLGTVGIKVRVLAGALEDDKLAALLVYVEATFLRERGREREQISKHARVFKGIVQPTLALKALLAKAPEIASTVQRAATMQEEQQNVSSYRALIKLGDAQQKSRKSQGERKIQKVKGQKKAKQRVQFEVHSLTK